MALFNPKTYTCSKCNHGQFEEKVYGMLPASTRPRQDDDLGRRFATYTIVKRVYICAKCGEEQAI